MSTSVRPVRWILRTESADQLETTTVPPKRGDVAAPCGKDVDDLLATVAAEPRPTPPNRPWVLLNMVASADGASAGPEGKSRSLSSDGDRALFGALRAIADVVLAGAETVRTENYGSPRLPASAAQLRASRGQRPLPRMALASASLRLDPEARLFREAGADQPALIFTTVEAMDRVQATNPDLAKAATLLVAGEHTVHWPEAFRQLYDDFDARLVLVEGGPTVNAQLLEDNLVDELCLTIAPQLVGGNARRITDDTLPIDPLPMRLSRVFEEDGFLYLRYLRTR